MIGSVMSEFLLLGLVASVLAVFSANLAGVQLADRLFNLHTGFSPMLWSVGLAAGVAGVVLVGYMAVRPVLRAPPMRVLR